MMSKSIAATLLRFALTFIAVFCGLSLTAAHAGNTQSYPATGFWNGFLSQLNILECSNTGASSTSLNVRLLDQSGGTLANRKLTLIGFATQHLILNDLSVLTDAYGTYQLSAIENSNPNNVRCLTSVYRLSKTTGHQVDYAYALPVQDPLQGSVSGLFNSVNPSNGATPVYNWLTLYNPTASEFRGTLKLYAFDGSLTSSQLVRLAGLERRDLPLGHNDSSNRFQNIGLYEIVPESNSSPYFASLIRYGSDQKNYRFAFPLFPSAGSAEVRLGFSATVNNALNWAEIANVGTVAANVTVRIRDRDGKLLSTEQRTVPPHAQSHVLANSSLGDNDLGTLEVKAADAASQLVLQNLFYGRDPKNSQILWAYAAQDLSARGGVGTRLGFPVNTFLGMANWLKVRNLDASARSSRLESFLPEGEQLRTEYLHLPIQGAGDIPLHERFGTNNVGFSFVSSTNQVVGTQAEVLRVFLGSQGEVQSVMHIPPLQFAEATVAVRLERVVDGLSSPVALTNAGDGSDRLFVSEREGKVRIVSNGTLLPTPFLDISSRVSTEGEMGILSVVFHPQFNSNRKLYLAFSENNYDTVISEFEASVADPNVVDPASEHEVFRLPQPHVFHKGGQLAFGTDGYLYVSLGDGGFSGDPLDNGQNMNVLYGKLIRIDVATLPYTVPSDNPFVGVPGVRPEIWASGFRNPWRFSFDSLTQDLFVGDVGENSLEEVDIVTRGKNYGWSTLEGTQCFKPTQNCDRTGTTGPVIEYPHPEGLAIVGGGVYRGTGVPALQGKYIFGDYVSGRIWASERNSKNTWTRSQIARPNFYISAFGFDEAKELYVVNFFGELHRFVEP